MRRLRAPHFFLALGKLGGELIQLGGMLLLGFFRRFCSSLRFRLGALPLGFLAKALAQGGRGMRPVLFGDFGDGITFEIETLARLLHRLEITQRRRVRTQGKAQCFAIEIRQHCMQLLVDADSQRLAIAKNGELFLQLLEQGTCGLDGGRRCGLRRDGHCVRQKHLREWQAYHGQPLPGIFVPQAIAARAFVTLPG